MGARNKAVGLCISGNLFLILEQEEDENMCDGVPGTLRRSRSAFALVDPNRSQVAQPSM